MADRVFAGVSVGRRRLWRGAWPAGWLVWAVLAAAHTAPAVSAGASGETGATGSTGTIHEPVATSTWAESGPATDRQPGPERMARIEALMARSGLETAIAALPLQLTLARERMQAEEAPEPGSAPPAEDAAAARTMEIGRFILDPAAARVRVRQFLARSLDESALALWQNWLDRPLGQRVVSAEQDMRTLPSLRQLVFSRDRVLASEQDAERRGLMLEVASLVSDVDAALDASLVVAVALSSALRPALRGQPEAVAELLRQAAGQRAALRAEMVEGSQAQAVLTLSALSTAELHAYRDFLREEGGGTLLRRIGLAVPQALEAQARLLLGHEPGVEVRAQGFADQRSTPG